MTTTLQGNIAQIPAVNQSEKSYNPPHEWQGCYSEAWGNLLTPESMSHPAKYSLSLIKRIFEYMLAQGYVKPGDTILDPFGGVANGGVAGFYGLNWIGVELEQRFVDMGAGCDCTGISPAQWLALKDRFKPDTIGQLAYTEGRHLCPACLAGAVQLAGSELPGHRQPGLFDTAEDSRLPAGFKLTEDGSPYSPPHRYEGNLSRFKKYAQPGTFARLIQGDSRQLRQRLSEEFGGLVSSPPYANGTVHGGVSVDRTKFDRKEGPNSQAHTMADYGRTEGQLGNLPPGSLADSLITSPPFAGNTGGRGEASRQGIDAALFDRHSGGMKRGTGENPDNLDHLPLKGFTDALISSPPYINSVNQSDGANDTEARIERMRQAGIDVTNRANVGGGNGVARQPQAYGKTEGQLGAMPAGTLPPAPPPPCSPAALISSPPFADSVGSDNPEKRGGLLKSDPRRAGDRNLTGSYGVSEGQLGAMKAEGLVSSPPFEKGSEGVLRANKFKDPAAFARAQMNKGHGCSFEAKMKAMEADNWRAHYGQTDGQLGIESKETFWAAARQIVTESYLALKPGAYSAWVVKAFVRDGQRVDFPGQWQQLCEVCGFEFVEEIRAMLVTDNGTQTGLEGEDKRLRKERKSFFRRLHESRLTEDQAHLRIDWETVLIMRKPEAL